MRDLLVAATDVTDLVGTRIYPEMRQQGEDFPAIVYQLVSTQPQNAMDGGGTIGTIGAEAATGAELMISNMVEMSDGAVFTLVDAKGVTHTITEGVDFDKHSNTTTQHARGCADIAGALSRLSGCPFETQTITLSGEVEPIDDWILPIDQRYAGTAGNSTPTVTGIGWEITAGFTGGTDIVGEPIVATRASMSFDSIAETYGGAKTLASAVRAVIADLASATYSTVRIYSCFHEGDSAITEDSQVAIGVCPESLATTQFGMTID